MVMALTDWHQCLKKLFVKTVRCMQKPRAVQFLREPMPWIKTAWYNMVILDTKRTWTTYINKVRKKAAKRLVMLSLLHNRKSNVCQKRCAAVQAA
jgi:hypothetical protein